MHGVLNQLKSLCAIAVLALAASANAADLTKVEHFALCKMARKGNAEALQEFVRRKTFSATDLSYIAARKLYIGMTEGAAVCAFGNPLRLNRTHTARGESIQAVYESGLIIYVHNGKVTAWQD